MVVETPPNQSQSRLQRPHRMPPPAPEIRVWNVGRAEQCHWSKRSWTEPNVMSRPAAPSSASPKANVVFAVAVAETPLWPKGAASAGWSKTSSPGPASCHRHILDDPRSRLYHPPANTRKTPHQKGSHGSPIETPLCRFLHQPYESLPKKSGAHLERSEGTLCRSHLESFKGNVEESTQPRSRPIRGPNANNRISKGNEISLLTENLHPTTDHLTRDSPVKVSDCTNPSTGCVKSWKDKPTRRSLVWQSLAKPRDEEAKAT